MNTSRSASYICRSCRFKAIQKRHVSTSLRTALDAGYARLRSRRLLAVHGPDAAHFLQGLTTQNIPTSGLLSSPASPQVLYSAFMNAQGRLLHDVFIYPLHPQHALRERVVTGSKDSGSNPAFVIEVDSEQIKALHGFLRKYKLRAKVNIRAIEEEELGIYSAWTGLSGEPTLAQTLKDPIASSSLLVAPDPRIPLPWSRVLAAGSDVKYIQDVASLAKVDESVYRLKRYVNGVPEGQHELPREETLLHEANVDLMQGVDFRKGCYVGQELVIRTQHTGVIRKRVMPVQIWSGEQPEDADNIEQPEIAAEMQIPDGLPAVTDTSLLEPMIGKTIKTKGAKRPEGKFLSGIANVGLGLCRLERVVELEDGVARGKTKVFEVDTEKSEQPMERTWVRPFIPDWWEERGQVMEGGYESLKARAPGRKT